jgi:hypothetical protein
MAPNLAGCVTLQPYILFLEAELNHYRSSTSLVLQYLHFLHPMTEHNALVTANNVRIIAVDSRLKMRFDSCQI